MKGISRALFGYIASVQVKIMAKSKASASKETKIITEKGGTNIYDYVSLKELPNFADLNIEVQKLVKQSSLWDLYGVDWMLIFISFGLVFVSLFLMKSDNLQTVVLGIFILGCCHSTLAIKTAHIAAHGSLTTNKTLQNMLSHFVSDICGSFSADLGYDIHIKVHHPHTNIIGLGDSSTWKMPFLSRYMYMFVGPLFVPVITIPLVIKDIWGQWKTMIKYFTLMPLGLAINFYLLMNISGFTFWGAVLCTLVYRAVLSIPYIHVNIFQHIGLAMYSQKSRPKRIYQMSTGVLNLPRHPILDYTFGHSIISCHIEHHLFPRLSDNMCLKIKPLVSKFLIDNGLPYYEDTYMNRFWMFLEQYEELMVKAPPISHFVGIQ